MIKNQWYCILLSKELKANKLLGVTRMGEKMVLWRDSAGKPVCQADLCPHRGAALSIGCIQKDVIQCPFHGFEFDQKGGCTFIPANGISSKPPLALNVKTYPCREANGYIYIWWGEERDEYPSLPWFDDLDGSFDTVDLQDHWNVDYSRAIENQLDVFHLPFVHATTIGRGNRTIADGPYTISDEQGIQIWVFNRVDDGTNIAKKPSELTITSRPPSLRFCFPNFWMNHISDDIRITVFFTPIDDENCILYLRSYQRFFTMPVVKHLITMLFNPSNRVILNQDKRVVLTQRPKKSGLRIGEKMIPADQPVIEYRRIRENLQRRAGQVDDQEYRSD